MGLLKVDDTPQTLVQQMDSHNSYKFLGIIRSLKQDYHETEMHQRGTEQAAAGGTYDGYTDRKSRVS